MQARLGSVTALLALGLAASACCPPAAEAPPGAWRLSAAAGGNRPVAELDVSGDGRVGEEDARALQSLADAALARLRDAGIDPSVRGGYYQGPPAGEPPVLTARGGAGSVPSARLLELYVEARWLALQARLAAAGGVSRGGVVGGMLAPALRGYDAGAMEPAAVCAGVSALDLGAYEKAGLAPSAILDVDSTVWAGNGTDVFLASMIAQELPRPEANAELQAFLATVPGVDVAQVERNSVLANAELLFQRATDPALPESQRVSTKDAFYNIVALLEGVRVEDARRAARLAVFEGAGALPAWKTRLFGDLDGCGMDDLVRRLLARGVQVYFLSATPDVMVEQAGELLGLPAGHALGSVLEVKDGVYTGRVRDNSYAVKGPITRQLLPAPPVLAFGDSPTSDLAMLLEATAAGFMVNPRAAFLHEDAAEAGGRLVALTFDGTVSELAPRAQAPKPAGP